MAADPLGGGLDAEQRSVGFVAMLGVGVRNGLGPRRGQRGLDQGGKRAALLVGMAAVDGDRHAEQTDSHRGGDEHSRAGGGERSLRRGHDEAEPRPRRHDRGPVQQVAVRAVRNHGMNHR